MSAGIIALVAGGVTKIQYVPEQSEPEYLGWDLLTWLKPVVALLGGSEAAVKAKVIALTAFPLSHEITGPELAAVQVNHPEITSKEQFYCDMRGCQGDPAATLNFGLYEELGYVALDSQTCQWGYVIDFDARVFEVYRGARFTPPTLGRWAGLPFSGYGSLFQLVYSGPGVPKHYPIQRVESLTFLQVTLQLLPTRWWDN